MKKLTLSLFFNFPEPNLPKDQPSPDGGRLAAHVRRWRPHQRPRQTTGNYANPPFYLVFRLARARVFLPAGHSN